MAPLPVIPGVSRVTFNWTFNSEPARAVNVMHFRTALDPEGLVEALEGVLSTTAGDAFAAVNQNVKVQTLDIIELDGTSPTVRINAQDEDYWAGQAGGGTIPQGCALVSLKTNVRGPQGRGRVYLPMIGEGAQDSGALDPGIVLAMQDSWVALNATMAAAHATNIVVASYTHEVARALNQQPTVSSRIATQRRRNRR